MKLLEQREWPRHWTVTEARGEDRRWCQVLANAIEYVSLDRDGTVCNIINIL